MDIQSSVLNKQKVAIYIRVSTHWQVDKDSLQVQRRELTAYADMVLGIKDYEVFEDPGYSAKNTDRPAYQSMMARLRTGEFSHLLVWKLDRISRNLLDFTTMYNELRSLGVVFISKNEQFDTGSAIGEAMLKIILVFAELERKMTAERVTAVMLSKANAGDWNGGRIPYGYKYDKSAKTFSLDEYEIKVYRMIIALYEDNQSILYVARRLNDEGITTRSGKLWTGTSIYKVLTNVWYTGAYRYNVHNESAGTKKPEKEWITVPDHHVAAIDDVRFDRIQFILKRGRRGGVPEGETYVRKNIHIFAGLIKCGCCGANMSATLDKRRADGWRPSIYGCSVRRHNTSACNNKYVNDSIIVPFVFTFLSNILRARDKVSDKTTHSEIERILLVGTVFDGIAIEPDDIEEIRSMLLSGETGLEYRPSTVFNTEDAASRLNSLEDRKLKDEAALTRLHTLYLYGDGSMSEKDYLIDRKRIETDLEEANSEISNLRGSIEPDIKSSALFLEKASYFLLVEKLLDPKCTDYIKVIRAIDPSIPRNFIHTVIGHIVLTDGRVTEIQFKNGLTARFINS